MTPLCLDLTDREEQVIRLIAEGCGMREIAQALGITEGTVKAHREHVRAKLRARNQAHAVNIWRDIRDEAAVG